MSYLPPVTTATAASPGSKALTSDVITKRINSAGRAPHQYWKVADPSSNFIKLTGAERYVAKNWANQPANDHFVYYPDYRVAGTVSAITNALRQAGIQTIQVGALNQLSGGQLGQASAQVPLSEDAIRNNAIDPLNPQHKALIDRIVASTPRAQKAPAKFSMDQYISMAKSLKGQKGGTKAAAPKAARGTRNPEANRARLVGEFDAMMTAVLSGQEPAQIFDLTKFDASKFTTARKTSPPKTTRATSIRPVINVNGRQVAVPIMTQPAGADNFRAFVQSVVAQSPQYGRYANDILNSFNTRLTQPIPVATVSQPSQLPGLGGGQLPQPGGFQPPSGGTPLPSFGGTQLPQPGATSPGGFPLPTGVGGLPTRTQGLPGLGSTSPGGLPLPTPGSTSPGGVSLQLPPVQGIPTSPGRTPLPTLNQ